MGKGFDYEECYLTFDGEIFAIAENKKNAKVIGETLIQLFYENEQLKSEKQAIIDILDKMENGDGFWDRDYLIDRISDIEIAIGVYLDD